ncbi:hypothetical protein PoB_003286500 [Plakobranchus ocellatus]|uniref:Uncharacterized protein n=1 Tax=Plakobranchus ocellatus TaxID=259542 RepID=A0AAV4AHV7_9GAST|nr:hypothetical protein PoB_003286500 [Plakobranchus ocellatus]
MTTRRHLLHMAIPDAREIRTKIANPLNIVHEDLSLVLLQNSSWEISTLVSTCLPPLCARDLRLKIDGLSWEEEEVESDTEEEEEEEVEGGRLRRRRRRRREEEKTKGGGGEKIEEEEEVVVEVVVLVVAAAAQATAARAVVAAATGIE